MLLLLLIVASPAVIVNTKSFQFASSSASSRLHHSISRKSRSAWTLLSAHYLTTALECLWEERISNNERDYPSCSDNYRYISWLDIAGEDRIDDNVLSTSAAITATTAHNTTNTNTIDSDRLPLYPLNEVYLPSSNGVNYTLNNVEPQNIQMALDILSRSSSSIPPRFCAVLRATDTGRVATIANVLRIINAEEQKSIGGDDDDIARIRLTCQSEGLVEIIEIENGSRWKENRLRQSKEYLWARVKPLVENDDYTDDERNVIDQQRWQDIYKTLREDIRTIKLMYQLELGADEFPPGMLLRLGNAVQDFPALDDFCTKHTTVESTVESSTSSFILWNIAQEWQSVCMTLRQGRQVLLSAERNERMVAAASAKEGPLLLPIHMEDLDPNSRFQIQQLDKEAQEVHEQSGMDPVLDFQVLLGLPMSRRFEFLAQLVSRERRRLEAIASSPSRRR